MMEEVNVDEVVGPKFVDLPDSIPVPGNVETVRVVPTESVDVDSVRIDTETVRTGTRRRGRPPGSKNRPKTLLSGVTEINTGVKGRVASEVSARGQMVLKATTGVASIWRPYFQMTPTEAQDIADPAASWAVRQAEHSEAVEAFIDNFDIVAVIMGCTKYIVRVIKDDREYRSEQADREHVEPSQRNLRTVRPDQRVDVERQSAVVSDTIRPEYDNDHPAPSVPFIGNL